MAGRLSDMSASPRTGKRNRGILPPANQPTRLDCKLATPDTVRRESYNCNMSEERRPRSRFDSDDNDRPVRSRFDTDRRSRSPSRKESESHRARSPIAREGNESPAATSLKNKAAAAAAAAAARINAQIQAKKGIQHVEVPPIRSAPTPPAAVKSPSSNSAAAISNETYQQDGDFIKDIEINDLRNRYTLTKGATQRG
ncbi:hypothetical protein P3342_009200 [Pyrenophora teres f. teres]|nr:hypothetical protein P3342_009200 [Pyrenophora teres f. teres]